MVFKKLPAGAGRDLIYKFRVRPQFKPLIDEKVAWLRQFKGWEGATVSDVIRLAMEQYLKSKDDPRSA